MIAYETGGEGRRKGGDSEKRKMLRPLDVSPYPFIVSRTGSYYQCTSRTELAPGAARESGHNSMCRKGLKNLAPRTGRGSSHLTSFRGSLELTVGKLLPGHILMWKWKAGGKRDGSAIGNMGKQKTRLT